MLFTHRLPFIFGATAESNRVVVELSNTILHKTVVATTRGSNVLKPVVSIVGQAIQLANVNVSMKRE